MIVPELKNAKVTCLNDYINDYPTVANKFFERLVMAHTRVSNNTSAMLILNTEAPQECVLSPLLCSLFTYDCVAKHDSNTIINLLTTQKW
jgi:hypothetical protein